MSNEQLTYFFNPSPADRAEGGVRITGVDDGNVRRFDVCVGTLSGDDGLPDSRARMHLIEAFWSRAKDCDITGLCCDLESEFDLDPWIQH